MGFHIKTTSCSTTTFYLKFITHTHTHRQRTAFEQLQTRAFKYSICYNANRLNFKNSNKVKYCKDEQEVDDGKAVIKIWIARSTGSDA